MNIQTVLKNISKNQHHVTAYLIPKILDTKSLINTKIGKVQIFSENNKAIINSHHIIPGFRKNGYGKFLIYNSEKIISNQLNLNTVQINLWCNDRCYFNYHNYYSKIGYKDYKSDNFSYLDNGCEIKYLLTMEKIL